MIDKPDINEFGEKRVDGKHGGSKFDGDKAQYSLLPPDSLEAVAEVMTKGALKYSANNWVGLELRRVLDALQRHINAFQQGEDYAIDSGQHHLAHAMANAMMAYHIAMNRPGQDDRLFKKTTDNDPCSEAPSIDDTDCLVPEETLDFIKSYYDEAPKTGFIPKAGEYIYDEAPKTGFIPKAGEYIDLGYKLTDDPTKGIPLLGATGIIGYIDIDDINSDVVKGKMTILKPDEKKKTK